jgi:bis(5'-nucleosidyl)-tetraphosphatase
MVEAKVTKDEAFGIIPILRGDSEYLFLLIQHHAGHWGFPKGHADPGESPLQAACRELGEETGISDYQVLAGMSFLERYTFSRNGKKFEKTVVYYPAFVRTSTVNYQREEIKAYSWANFQLATTLLSFGGGKRILADVNRYLATRGDRP